MSTGKPIANILVIDDESDIVHVITAGLHSNGFQAKGFTSPSMAMEHLRQHASEYCAVLSDIRMPESTGFQVAREVKKINPKLKVVLMSAFEINTADFGKVMPSTRVDDFVRKPASMGGIKDVLMKHVGQTKRILGRNESM